MDCSIEVVLPNLPDDGQIYARNLKGPAERDLPYIALSEGNLDGN